MKKPLEPADEHRRLAALQELDIIYSPAEERFDRITRVAQRLFDVPIALISLVDQDIQWFKSCQGLATSETKKEISFCGHAILREEALVVEDALEDPVFSDNPLVMGSPGIRFYAGQPIRFLNQNLGTLCIIDNKPRTLTRVDLDSLHSMAAWVETELLMWRNSKNPYLKEILEHSDRSALIDGVTGDLNGDGLALVQSSMTTELDSDTMPIYLNVEILNPDQDIGIQDMIRKFTAQCIRSVLDGRGLLSCASPSRFVVILPDSLPEQVEDIVAVLKNRLSKIIIDTSDGEYTPQITITERLR